MSDSFNILQLLMLLTFLAGYFFVTTEHWTKVNKSGVVLLMAVISWLLLFLTPGVEQIESVKLLLHHLGNISQVIFFILGALAIVEMINAHQGFKIISSVINITSKKKMLWVMGFVTFFLSSVLDNLTTTIIMISFLQKIVPTREDRWILGGAVVIAANAGGAWTPIGDVTTTMLWIGGQITSIQVMKELIFPSLMCLVASLTVLSFLLKGNFEDSSRLKEESSDPHGNLMLVLGLGSLIFVPIFKTLTGLPPFMGVLLGLSIMWVVSDILNGDPEREHLKMTSILSRIDISGVLFFFGILMTISVLEASGILDQLAHWMNGVVSHPNYLPVAIGLVSAIVDNIPLVAASMGMYHLSQFPVDAPFWQLIAYCAGTGGSILIIGSAAGVAFMSMEKVDFFWYARRIGLAALVGYFAGILAYLL